MAFQDKTSSNFFKLNDLKQGATYECYPVKIIDVEFDGRAAKNLVVVNAETDEVQTTGTPGNIKYLVQEGRLEMGQLTRFTRIEDRKYGNLKGSQFKVEQDPDNVLSDDRAEKVGAEATKATPINSKQLAAEKVKREAEALAAQATKR